MKSRLLKIVILLFFFAQFCESSGDKSDETSLEETEVPALIIKAFASRYPNAQIMAYSEEQEDGRKYFEIGFVLKNRRMTAAFSANGDLVEIEEVLDVAALPAPVYQALVDSYKRFRITEVERTAPMATHFTKSS